MNRSMSPTSMGASHYHASNQPSFLLASFQGSIPSNASEEILKLRKELRMKEAEFSKEKAVLQQKVHLLEL